MSPDNPYSQNSNKQSGFREVLQYILLYTIFLVFLIISAFLLFRLRINSIQIGFLLGYNQVQVKGISNLTVLISGVMILIGIIFSEDYLRRGVVQNEFWKRALRIFLVEIGLILFSLLVYGILLWLAV